MPDMRSQAERDQQTLTIGTFLAIFVGVLVVGVLIGVLIEAVGSLSEGVASALGIATLLVAGVVSFAYLVRHRRS